MATDLALQALVTKTATFNGSGLDISGVSGDFTIVLEITQLTANAGQTPKVAFAISDTVDAFTNKITRATFNTAGAVNQDGKQHGLKMTWRRRDLQGIRGGTTSANLRLELVDISGTGASVSYQARVQVVS